MEAFSDNGDDEIIFLGKEDTEQKRAAILRKRKETPYGNETPLELENKAGLYKNDTAEMKKIHELYEKARYEKRHKTEAI